eukprot:11879869-Alexandrium_andersonii.AAC.1
MVRRQTGRHFKSSSRKKTLLLPGPASPLAPRRVSWRCPCEHRSPAPSRHGVGTRLAAMKSSTTTG